MVHPDLGCHPYIGDSDKNMLRIFGPQTLFVGEQFSHPFSIIHSSLFLFLLHVCFMLHLVQSLHLIHLVFLWYCLLCIIVICMWCFLNCPLRLREVPPLLGDDMYLHSITFFVCSYHCTPLSCHQISLCIYVATSAYVWERKCYFHIIIRKNSRYQSIDEDRKYDLWIGRKKKKEQLIKIKLSYVNRSHAMWALAFVDLMHRLLT